MVFDSERLPVIVAYAQATEKEELVGAAELMNRATASALDGTGPLANRIDRVSVVGIMSKISPSPATDLAERFHISPQHTEITQVGGNFPQWLISRAADEIASGNARAVMIAGAEAQHTQKMRRKLREQGIEPPPSTVVPGTAGAGSTTTDPGGMASDDTDVSARNSVPDNVVGDPRAGVSSNELAAGLIAPVHIYPMFESVLASRAQRTYQEQREFIAGFLSSFSEVAAKHPFAWFPQVRSPQELYTITPQNRLIAEPYPKLMSAFIDVNQAACVIVTSLAVARECGLAESAIYCWSGADVNDVWYPSSRPDPGVSQGIREAGRAALDAANVSIDDISLFDLYSCFPCAVELACNALGIGLDDSRGLTVTGGLPYFGGPGNNYTLHAIATMADRLKESGGVGLVSGLGWYATKHSIGIYSDSPPVNGWVRGDVADAQARIDAGEITVVEGVEVGVEVGTVVASTIIVDAAGNPESAPVIVTLGSGQRVVGTISLDELAGLSGVNLVGKKVAVQGTPPVCHLT